MSYPFWFSNKRFQIDEIKVGKEQYNKFMEKCLLNSSKTSSILLSNNKRKRVYLIDGKLYCGDSSNSGCFHEIVEEYSEEEAKQYKELFEFCVSNFFAVENKTLPEHLAEKWLEFCDKNKDKPMLCDAFNEFNKRKEKI